jgi:hypothetical protein
VSQNLLCPDNKVAVYKAGLDPTCGDTVKLLKYIDYHSYSIVILLQLQEV